MFITITTNEGKRNLVRNDDVVGITELPSETEKLYDELGNVVSETPKAPTFQVLIKNDGSRLILIVDETEYDRLVAELK